MNHLRGYDGGFPSTRIKEPILTRNPLPLCVCKVPDDLFLILISDYGPLVFVGEPRNDLHPVYILSIIYLRTTSKSVSPK